MKNKAIKHLLAMVPILALLLVSGGVVAGPASERPRGAEEAFTLGAYTVIAASWYHTCALANDGGVKCWGSNSYGQLGDGTATNRSTPVDVSGLTSGVIAIAAGGDHTCALMADGSMKCWGRNDFGQLGDGTWTDRNTPVNVRGLTSGVVAIAAGGSHTCALIEGGHVKCWGANWYGQLGDGTTRSHATPVVVSGLTGGVVAIAAGEFHTCALTVDGGVKCWGSNSYGQLGDGTATNRSTPVDVSGLTSGVIAIAAGGDHTCALMADGGVKCWGANVNGQLGDGTRMNRNIPVDVSGLSTGVAIAAGGAHTCAVTADGGVKCWGSNSYGQLGDGTRTWHNTPVDVSGLTSGVVAIAAGGAHTCALMADGGVKCWGRNDFGQLGNGRFGYRLVPADVSGLTSRMIATAAGGTHTCAVTVDGGVKCWGSNNYGQLGDGTTLDRNIPVDVSELTSGVVAVAAGGLHTCALMEDSSVRCWGANWDGQLGDGTTTQRTTPVTVSGLTGRVVAIATGGFHTCALMADDGVKCWGANWYGQLGDGTTRSHTTPVAVSGLTGGVVAIAAGGFHTCALTVDGGVKCWGRNDLGQLGDGTWTDRNTPVDVRGLSSGVVAITAGEFHTCALMADGGVKCWGSNDSGQLGDGDWAPRNTPVDVSELSTGAAIAAGGAHTCALTAGGGARCWGYNSYGQLGDGTVAWHNTPVGVSGLADGAVAITAGELHTCALVEDGIKCWGANWYGQLGVGEFGYSSTPVDVVSLQVPPTPTGTPTPTYTPTVTPTGTPTRTATPTATPTVTLTAPAYRIYLPLTLRLH